MFASLGASAHGDDIKTCFPQKSARAAYYAANKEKWKGYAAKRREARQAYARRWAKENPEKRREIERRSRQKNLENRQANNRKRQQMLAGVAQELYTWQEIFIRDVGVCQICKEPVIERNRMHRLGPTIDHIVPLSLGGSDTRGNVQLAHRSCNCRKSNRPTI